MKNILLLLCAFFLCAKSFPQKKDAAITIPDFGVVDKADLEMKECSFDEKAEAMFLIDDATMELDLGNDPNVMHRIRIKILNKDGLDWANVHLRYIRAKGEEDIKELEAQTYNLAPDGSVVVTKVDKKQIFDKALNKKYSERVFTFPEVKVGSIIEYRYKHIGGGTQVKYFQRSIPVRYSHFKIDFPEEVTYVNLPYNLPDLESKDESKSSRVIRSFTMHNVPGLRDEPYIVNEDFYRGRMETKITAIDLSTGRKNLVINWGSVIKDLMEDEDFGIQLNKNIPRTADLDEKLKNITVPYEKMRTVYKYVQSNMEWNEYTGIWALDGVKSAWKSKKGTVGEINLILVNLLQSADLDAHAILVSTHDNGIVNTIDAGTLLYPGYRQFNKVMAYVTIDGKVYVLDATDKNMPAHLIPSDVLLTEGLVIERLDTHEWGWKTLWRDNLYAKSIILIKGDIDENGKMNGEASVNSYDYARLSRQQAVKNDKKKFIDKFIVAPNPGISIDDVQIDNLDSDSLPLIQHIKFNETLNSAGDYKYFSINMLSGLEKNPFIADNRSSDVFFGVKQMYQIIGSYTLPAGYEFADLPKNLQMRLPDTSIIVSRISQVSENILQTRISLEFRKPMYNVSEYGELQEFYKKLYDILNEQFVIRKKKNA